MNEAIVTEYVELCDRLVGLDAAAERQLYARLDQLWYEEMTDADRAEADRRLSELDGDARARLDARRAEDRA